MNTITILLLQVVQFYILPILVKNSEIKYYDKKYLFIVWSFDFYYYLHMYV